MSKKSFEIIINGEKHLWSLSIITMLEVGRLAYKNSSWYKKMVVKNPFAINSTLNAMSATFKNAHPDIGKQDGIMKPAEAIRIQDGTIFNIYETSNA